MFASQAQNELFLPHQGGGRLIDSLLGLFRGGPVEIYRRAGVHSRLVKLIQELLIEKLDLLRGGDDRVRAGVAAFAEGRGALVAQGQDHKTAAGPISVAGLHIQKRIFRPIFHGIKKEMEPRITQISQI